MHRIAVISLALLATAPLHGCATPPSYTPGLVVTWDKNQTLAVTPAPPIDVQLSARRTFYDDRSSRSWVNSQWSKRTIKKHLHIVAKKFPFLANAHFNGQESAYRLVIDATHAHRGDLNVEWSHAATLYIRPHTLDCAVELDATLYYDSERIRTYRAVGHYIKHRHFLSWMPLTWRFWIPSQVIRDTWWDVLLQIHQDADELFAEAR